MRAFGAPPRRIAVLDALRLAALVALAAGASLAHAGSKWASIPAADLALARPTLDPEASAEILLRTIRIEDEIHGGTIHTILKHEMRTKIFDARGAEEAGRIEITYPKDVTVRDLAARTVHPDGSVVELTKDQFFDRTLAKGSGTKLNVKSFAFPAATPGSVLEYRWTEIRYEDDAGSVYLEFQRAHPVRQTDLYLKPLPLAGTGFNFKMRTFNMPTPAFVESRDGFQYAALPPTPAARDEVYAPPTRQTTPWAIFYYTYGADPLPAEIWNQYAARRLRTAGPRMEPDAFVRTAALEACAPATTPVGKADRLADWCRSHIVNIYDDRIVMSDEERSKEPVNKTPADTIRRRRGTSTDINYLFIAMCRAVGLDATLALGADRSIDRFDSRLGIPQLLDQSCAALAVGDAWRFYDPASMWLGPGWIPWNMQGQELLILDKANPRFTWAPLAPPESSIVFRSASLRLGEDGDAVGTCRKEFRGHQGEARHERYDELTREERLAKLRLDGPANAKEAAFDSVQIENADDPFQPVIEMSKIKVTSYAQPVGDRLLVPLSFFVWKAPPDFPSVARTLPVQFNYPWAVSDTVRIEVPEGYEIEELPEDEPPLTKGVARFSCATLASTDGRTVIFIRNFSFGVGGVIAFPVEQYASLKRLFDGIQRRDEATLSLKRKS
ncbi:MAG TPA: DUF3857 domain-containing protein [Candidatus Eisenbacteria bacterium]|nr:DUF3857 domain-containing protein [Candidatus Eisenbacteria bacterium]